MLNQVKPNPPHMHPNHYQIITALKSLDQDPSPWVIAIHQSLPNEGLHVTLIEQLASQAKDEPSVMIGIVGVRITELLLNRKITVK